MSEAKPTFPVWAILLSVAMFCATLIVIAALAVFVLVTKASPQPAPVANLAALVPDDDARAQLSAFYGDFAAVVRSDAKPLRTTGDFRTAYRLAVPVFQQSGRLPSVQAIDAPIADRLAAAIGKADAPLDGDPPVRANLAAALDSVSADFGGR